MQQIKLQQASQTVPPIWKSKVDVGRRARHRVIHTHATHLKPDGQGHAEAASDPIDQILPKIRHARQGWAQWWRPGGRQGSIVFQRDIERFRSLVGLGLGRKHHWSPNPSRNSPAPGRGFRARPKLVGIFRLGRHRKRWNTKKYWWARHHSYQ